MKQTAVEWLQQEVILETNLPLNLGDVLVFNKIVEKAKEIEYLQKLKHQLFVGKVMEIIGDKKTIELLKECHETFKSE